MAKDPKDPGTTVLTNPGDPDPNAPEAPEQEWVRAIVMASTGR